MTTSSPLPFVKILVLIALGCCWGGALTVAQEAPSFKGDGILTVWAGEHASRIIPLNGSTTGLSVAIDGLPDSITYSLSGSTITLQGTPPLPGYFPLQVTATNAAGAASRFFLFTVRAIGWELLGNSSWGGYRPIAFGDAGFLSASSTMDCARSLDGRSWDFHRDPDPPDSYPEALFTDIIWGAGRYVAVTHLGEILTSTDGCDWTLRENFWDSEFQGLGYGGGQFVAVGSNGAIATAPDGITWALQDSGTTGDLRHVAYGAGRYVAVGANGLLMVSENGEDWVSRPAPTAQTLNRIAWGGDRFVAVGRPGTRLISDDGWDWISRTNPEMTAPFYTEVAYGNGHFLALTGSGGISTSTDGVEWRDFHPGKFTSLHRVAFGEGLFVATDTDGGFLAPAPYDLPVMATPPNQVLVEGEPTSIKIVATDNATGFLALNLPKGLILDPTSGIISGTPFEGGIFPVILGAYTATAPAEPVVMELAIYPQSSAPPRLIPPAHPILLTHMQSFAHHIEVDDPLGRAAVEMLDLPNGLFYDELTKTFGGNLPHGSHEVRICLTNPAGSVEATIRIEVFPFYWQPVGSGTSADLLASTAGNGLLLLVGNGGTILTSADDGFTWQQQASGTTANLRGTAFGAGMFVVVGDGGVILTSLDGVTWSQRGAGLAASLAHVTHGHDGWLACSSNLLLRSNDGIEWEPVEWNPSMAFTRMTYGHGTYVAAVWSMAGGYQIAWSDDGMSWNATPLSGSAFTGLIATPDGFAAAAMGGRIFFSDDGKKWSRVANVTGASFLAHGNARLLAMSNSTTSVSYDYARWSAFPSARGGFGDFSPSAALAAENAFYAIGQGGQIYRLGLPTPPVLNSPPAMGVRVGEEFEIELELDSVPSHAALTGLPTGISFDAERFVIAGRFDAESAHHLMLTTGNATGLQRQILNLASYPQHGLSPIITSPPALVIRSGWFLSHQITGDGFQNITRPTAPNLPGTLYLNPVTRLLDGTLYQQGDYHVDIDVPNLYGITRHTLLISVVSNAVDAPKITSPLSVAGGVGHSLSYIIATNPAATGFSALGLPAGLAIDPATGVITGIPTKAGVFHVVLKAENAAGDGGAVLALTIVGGLPAIVTEPSPLSIWYGNKAILQVSLLDAAGASYRWRKNGVFLENRPGLSGCDSFELQISATFEDAGYYDVLVSNPFGEITSNLVRLNVLETFASWLFSITLSPGDPPTADMFGLGINNLTGYALGIDPRAPDRSRLPRLERIGNDLTLAWARNVRAAVNISLERSLDLRLWEPADLIPKEASGEFWRVLVPADDEAAFYRLKIETWE